MNKDKVSKKGIIIIFTLFIAFTIFAIVGFILFSNRKAEVINEEKNGGNVVLNYSSDVSFLNVQNAVPTTDAVGMVANNVGSYFDFSVDTEIDDANSITYELSIKKVSGTINDSDIIVYLEEEDSGTYNSVLKPTQFKSLKKKTDIGTTTGNMILMKKKISKAEIDNYRIRTWVSESSLLTSANYQLEINIVAKAD